MTLKLSLDVLNLVTLFIAHHHVYSVYYDHINEKKNVYPLNSAKFWKQF